MDIVLDHMSNSRYFRELDLARIDFYTRTGLYEEIRKNGGGIFLGNANIRFRRFIKIFSVFKITTKIVYWDDDSIFTEHRFVGKDGMVHAILLCQNKVVKCSGEKVMNELLSRGTNMLPKPEMSQEVKEKNLQLFYYKFMHSYFFRWRNSWNFKKHRGNH